MVAAMQDMMDVEDGRGLEGWQWYAVVPWMAEEEVLEDLLGWLEMVVSETGWLVEC
jgi:hypothetical protein